GSQEKWPRDLDGMLGLLGVKPLPLGDGKQSQELIDLLLIRTHQNDPGSMRTSFRPMDEMIPFRQSADVGNAQISALAWISAPGTPWDWLASKAAKANGVNSSTRSGSASISTWIPSGSIMDRASSTRP